MKKVFQSIIGTVCGLTMAATAAAEPDPVLFHAHFDGVLRANKAAGSQLAEAGTRGTLTFVPGVAGQAVRMSEGAGVYFEQAHNIALTQGTVAFWMRAVDWEPAGSTPEYNWIFAAAQIGAEGDRIQLFKMPGPTLMTFVGKEKHVAQLVHALDRWERNRWYFVAFTYGGGQLGLFIDGSPAGRVELPAENLPTDTGTRLALQSSSGTTDYDELKIYNRVLTDGEIENLYLSMLPPGEGRAEAYIPRLVAGPVTGTVPNTADAPEWREFSGFSGFLEIPSMELSARSTEVRMAYSPEALLLRLTSPIEPGDYPHPATPEELWQAPSAEILLTPQPDGSGPVYQLAFNIYGQSLWLRNSHPLPGHATIRVETSLDSWSAVVAIPYADLNVDPPEPGTRWRFNVGRNFLDPKNFANPALTMAYGDTSAFWELDFAAAPGGCQSAEVDQKTQTLVLSPLNSAPEQHIRVYLKKLPQDLTFLETELKKVTVTPGKVIVDQEYPGDAPLRLPLPGMGRYAVLVENSTGFRQLFHFQLRDTLAASLKFYSADREMSVNWEVNYPLDTGFALQAQILDERETVIAEEFRTLAAHVNSGSIGFSMESLTGLDYTLRLRLEAAGRSEERDIPFQCFYQAPWIGFEAALGVNRKLLPPWTPIAVHARTVRTLTQEYRFNSEGFPEQVFASGTALLAAPARLELATAAGPVPLTSPMRWVEQTPAEVRWQADYGNTDIAATLDGTLEFDGMIRYDLTVVPRHPGNTAITAMRWHLPVRREIARYKLPFAGPYQKWLVIDMNTEIDGVYADAFMPQLWVGDDLRGIAWFAESDQNYLPESRERVVELRPEADAVELQINMVEAPLPLAERFTYTFGMQATPAKPLPPDWTSYHFASSVSTTRQRQFSTGYTTGIEYHRYGGIPYPTKDDDRALRFVTGQQATPGFRALAYATSNGIGGSSPEFRFFEQEWKNPLNCDTWTLSTRGELHWGANPCSRSWRDYFLWSTVQAVERFGFDGFYYDFGTVMALDNPVTGSGYERDGKRYPIWPIFADRAMRRAIYEIVMDRRGHADFIFHNYSQIVTPIASFATMLLDGEPYQQRTGVIGVKVSSDYTELIPLSRLKTTFGRQFGIVPVFLVKFQNSQEPSPELTRDTRTVIALMQLHGVAVWGFYCDIGELNRYIAFQDGFGLDDCTFVAYYEQQGEVALQPEAPQVYVSLWRKPDGAMLALAGNLGTRDYHGTLALPGREGEMWDFSLQDGTAVRRTGAMGCELNIKAKDYQLIRLEQVK